MLGPIGLWRSVLLRARADWPVAVAAWLLLVCAATLLAAGLLYADTVAVGGLRQAVLDAPPRERTIAVWTIARTGELRDLDAAISMQLGESIRDVGGEVALVARSSWLSAQDLDGEQRRAITGLAAYEGIERHATLTGGRWPRPGVEPLEVALPTGAASAAGLALGDALAFADRRNDAVRVETVVVGTWEPNRGDPYWRELGADDADDVLVASGPAVAAIDELRSGAIATDLDAEWRVLPDIAALRVASAESLARAIDVLPSRLDGAVADQRELSVDTGLPGILGELSRSILVSRSAILVLIVQFAVLAGYAVVLLAGILVERRRAEAALLRSRGAGPRHMAAMAFGEAILLALPAAIAAPVLALAVVRLLGVAGPLAGAGILGTAGIAQDTVLVSAAAAAACVLGLALPTVLSDANPAGIRASLGRQAGRTFAQRVGVDFALLVLAAIGLWQLRLYGAPLTRNARGVLGVDPLLVAAPAIGLVAGAVLATRILPRLADVGERLLTARRGLVSPLGARQLARRPLRYTRSALLLMLAAALGTFAAVYTATWTRSQGEQAAYRSAGGVRLVAGAYPELPAWAVGAALSGVPGVDTATPVVSHLLGVGRAVRDGQIVGVEPASAAAAAARAVPGDTALATALAELGRARPTTPAVTIPGTPRRLRVTIDANLGEPGESMDDAPIPIAGQGIRIAAVVADADGRIHRATGEEAAFGGNNQRVEIPLAAAAGEAGVAPRAPLALLALEVTVRAPAERVLVGTIELRSIQSSDAASGEAWKAVPLDPAAPGWAWQRRDDLGISAYAPRDGAAGRIDIGIRDSTQPPVFGSGGVPPVFRLGAQVASEGRLPAVASTAFLDRTGARVGDTVAGRAFGVTLDLEIAGAADAVPPYDLAGALVVVDLASLELRRWAATGDPGPAAEWWLAVEPGREAAVIDALRAAPFAAEEVIGREELTLSLTADPVPLGVAGALGLGSVAAMAFAAIAFLVSATVSTSERIGEFAILRALGLSLRQLSTWLTLENAFLLAFGLAAGTGIGLLLAWLVLPFATLTRTGEAAVPAPRVVVPLDALLPLYGLALGLLVATVVVIGRQLPRVRITDVLRGRDE